MCRQTDRASHACYTMDEELRFAFLSAWRAFRNGLFYGTKIRLPHALVMTLLFRRSNSIRAMADPIARMTWEHSRNLALFAGFYKIALAIARIVWSNWATGSKHPRESQCRNLIPFLQQRL